jgi:wyosine [tRNA(Phe)-imidazoG37] synthetase (radical SAM superfamily)/lysophospholipase L1-like esterase
VGVTTCLTLKRDAYVPAAEVLAELDHWLKAGVPADFITLAGSGEPTLNTEFGKVLRAIKAKTAIRTALLTNGTLLGDPQVQSDAAAADVVKVSLSAWDQESLARVNRPAAGFGFDRLVSGMQDFRRRYSGELWIEVFVVPGVNDSADAMRRIAELVNTLAPARIHLNSLNRPPADPSVRPLDAERLRAFVTFFRPHAQTVGGAALAACSSQAPSREKLVAVLRRRPCTAADVAVALGGSEQAAAAELDGLVAAGLAEIQEVAGDRYYRVLLRDGVDSKQGSLAEGVAMSERFVLRKGDRIVFLGDSITEQQLYTNYVEAYLASRYPELKLTFFNAGWGGDTALGGCKRLERDVLALKPTVVTICYGMNDGGYCVFNSGIRDAYVAGMKELVARLKAAGVRVVLLTPGMADESVNPDLRKIEYNMRSLRVLADEVLALAAAEQLPVADLHKLMNEADRAAKAANPGFSMIPDSIHPDPAGHLVMAYGLLQALGVPPRCEELMVDLAAHKATGTERVGIKYLRRNLKGVDLTVRLDTIPFFVEPQARKVLPYLPFQETYNAMKLVVKGLTAERAYIRLGAFRGAAMRREQFEKGINLFDFWGGDAMKVASTVHAFTREKDQLYFRLWRVLGLSGAAGAYNMLPHQEAVKMGPLMDRARDKMMPRSALNMGFTLSPTDRPGEPLSDGDFIGRWSLLGPFPRPFTDDKVGGEAALTASVPVLPAGWTASDLELEGMTNNLTPVFGVRTDCFAYALTMLESPIDQDAELLLGSDDGFAVWLNGEQVGANLDVGRWLAPDSDKFRAKVRKGRNVLLVKITQVSGEWGFCVRFQGLCAPLWALRPGEQS